MYVFIHMQIKLKILHLSCFLSTHHIPAGPGSSVGCASAWYSDGCGFDPRVRQHSYVEIGHEIISTAILSLPLIQVSYWRKDVHLILVNRLGSLSRNSVVWLTDGSPYVPQVPGYLIIIVIIIIILYTSFLFTYLYVSVK